MKEYGLQVASPGSPPIGINGSAVITPDPINLEALQNLTQSDILLANLPGLYYRLLKTDTNTRTLANPQLRTAEGMPAQARFGERVPIPVTIFAPIAQGGVAQQPITSFNYENIGVNIDITPRTHHDDDVSLNIKVHVQSISGTGFGGLPTFGNREISTVIRLRDGETSMLAGLIRDDERQVVNGVPGLSDIPLVGKLFAHTKTETQQTDIILTLTPHIVRVLDLDESDLRAFRVGRDSLASASDIPLPTLTVPRPEEPAPGLPPVPDNLPAAQPIAPPPPPPPSPMPQRPPGH
jgi:general secretion pathway protein D